MGSSSRVISSAGADEDDVVYVAVNKHVSQSKSSLLYALQNWKGKRFCIVHVIVPALYNTFLKEKLPDNSMLRKGARALQERERQKVDKNLDEYVLLCHEQGAVAEKLVTESDSVEAGILQLFSQHGARKLVMGAAADWRYYGRINNAKSKKAIYVSENAPAPCHIQFVCQGHLIETMLKEDNRSYGRMFEQWQTMSTMSDRARKPR